jgi:hypothetical protein
MKNIGPVEKGWLQQEELCRRPEWQEFVKAFLLGQPWYIDELQVLDGARTMAIQVGQLAVYLYGVRVKAKVVKLGVCKCGDPFFTSNVKIGNIYTVYPETAKSLQLTCVGCRKTMPVICLLADQSGSQPPGYLAIELFELDEGTTNEALCNYNPASTNL